MTSPSIKSPRNRRVSTKIDVLMNEGRPQKQAVAMALEMERRHRLTDAGGYIRKTRRRVRENKY